MGTVPTFTDGLVVHQADLAFLLDPPKCAVYQTTGTTMTTSGTTYIVAFDTEEYDNDSCHDTVTNNSRVIFKTPGIYLVSWALCWVSNATGNRFGSLQLNSGGVAGGGTVLDIARSAAFGSGVSQVQSSTIQRFALNDYVEVHGSQTSGGSLATNPGRQCTRLQVVRVGT